MNKTTTALALTTLGIAYLGLINIAIITGIITAFTLKTSKNTKQSTGSSSNVKVQPIKVKRKYDGPESIYPDDMEINLDPASTGVKTDPGASLTGLGGALGSITKKIFKGGD